MGGSSKEQTIGYKYYLGMHLVLTHGPVDLIKWIKVDNRTAWAGDSTGGAININADQLFGGDSREGGVSGIVDFETGSPTQPKNAYLQSMLGAAIPAFRGVAALVLRQCYLGNNPYLKKWAARLQRIHKTQDGATQWYDAKAEMPKLSTIDAVQTYTEFETGWTTNAPNKFQIIDGQICNTLVNASNSDYWRIPAPAFTITGIYCEFKLINRDFGDPLGVRFDTAGGGQLFGFMPQAENVFDSLRRPHVNYWGTPIPIYESELSQDVNYSFEAQMNNEAGTYEYWLREGSEVLANGTAPLPAGTPAYVTFGRTSNAFPDRTGVAGYSKLVVSGYVKSGDMNPAHIIRECLTNQDWGMGYQASDIDDVSFISAADALYTEGMGISILWDKQMPIEDFVSEIIRHINAAIYVDRSTGKFVLKLIRDDYDESTLLVLNENNIEKVENYTRSAFGELVNSITVNFWDSVTGKTASVTADDPALIQLQESVIGTTLQYPGFTNRTIASRVAMRNLQALSAPLLSCTIFANREAKVLNIGDVFKFEWPDYHDDFIVMRVSGMAIGDGRNNTIRLTCMQDVFSLPSSAMVSNPPDQWEDVIKDATPSAYRIFVEAPYFELVQRLGQTDTDSRITANANIGYTIASASASAGAINARLAIDSGAGYSLDRTTPIDFCPYCISTNIISFFDTVIAVENFVNFESVQLGTHAQIGNELVKVTAVATDSITIGRGVLDTVPTSHEAGSVIMFWDVFGDSDAVEYVAGETLNAKILPTTGTGTLALEDATEDSLTFVSRAVRPYPPGNLKLNSLAYPASLDSPLVVTWAHRDRLQQTSGDIQDTTIGNIGPEAGTTYDVLFEEGGSVIESFLGVSDTTVTSTLTGFHYLKLVLKSKRDGLESFQSHAFEFVLNGSPIISEASEILFSEDDKVIILE